MNFRTPLNAILNSYKFIENTFKKIINDSQKIMNSPDCDKALEVLDENTPKMKKFISMGSNSSVLLLSLIEDILDLSKMDSGTFKINESDFIIEDLINECSNIFYFQWLLKKIKLDVEISNEVKSLRAYLDSGRIKQVLLNLLSNSFKFTFSGGITVGAKIQYMHDQNFLKLSVHDTGIGIKEEDQKGLFKLFGMVSSKNSLNPNGCGIGLTVSKKYITHMGGEIEFHSEYGVGTQVSVYIPYKAPIDSSCKFAFETFESLSIGDECNSWSEKMEDRVFIDYKTGMLPSNDWISDMSAKVGDVKASSMKINQNISVQQQ